MKKRIKQFKAVYIFLIFALLLPSVTLARPVEEPLPAKVIVSEIGENNVDEVLVIPEPIKEENEIVVEEPSLSAPIAQLLPEPLLTLGEDETPLDMYDNRDNIGLQPSNQAGQYNVDEFTGTFSYNYPLQIPAGRNNLQPSLSLSYNHRAQNLDSLVGFGWNLNIPSIERENRSGIDNIYDDNYFLLNGSRLVPISVDGNGYGSYGKLVDSDFQKIEFNSSNQWIVTDKLGTVYTYGATILSRQDNSSDSSQIYKWMLEEVRDTNDNFIRYEYYKDSGQIYPQKIIYTGYEVTDGIFEIDFEPFANSTPVENNELIISYQTGFTVQTKYLIDTVNIKVDGELVTSYELDLGLNDNNNKYLLHSIIPKFYKDQVEYIKDQVDFDYSYEPTTYSVGEGYDLPNNYHLGELLGLTTNKRDMFIDLNSDSFTDYIRINCVTDNLSTNVYLNNGEGGWVSSSAYSENFGSGFTCGGIGTRYSVPVSFAELNGDHLIDMITNTNVYYNNGSDWDTAISNTLPVSLFQSAGISGTPMNAVMFQDMNLDGYDDIVYNYHPDSSTAKVAAYIRNVSTGGWDLDADYNLEVNFPSTECMWGGDPFGFADLNNDGLLDVFYDYYCKYSNDNPADQGEVAYLNTGQSLLQTTEYNPIVEMSRFVYDSGSSDQNIDYFSDYDGDGIRDQGRFVRDGWTTVSNHWSSGAMNLLGNEIFATGNIAGSDYANGTIPVAIADFNGDQIQDVMHSWGLTSDIYYGHGLKLDILKQINYQSGAKVYIYYNYSTNEKDDAGNLLNPDLPFDLSVVKEVVVDNGLDNWQGYQYKYEEGNVESYPSEKIKDVYGFAKVSGKLGKAMPDIDMGNGSDGAFVSSGDATWTTDKNFTSLHIQSGHTITVEPEVVIKVQGEARIDGILTAEGKGYEGGQHVPWGTGSPGDGPGGGGGGVIQSTNAGGGGGGGGYVTTGQNSQDGDAMGGMIYGNTELEPIFSGSGGGRGANIGLAGSGIGGNGGGIVQLFAENVVITGEINADGNDGNDGESISGYYAGGGGAGSGGSIHIRVLETVDLGNGLLHANGGSGGDGGYFNDGGAGADGRIRVEAKTIIGSTSPEYYTEGKFTYSINNSLGAGLQKTTNQYHTAKDDSLYLHGKLKSNSKYDQQDNLLNKSFNQWQTYNLGNDRKFVYLDTEANTQMHLLEEGPLHEYQADANTIALYHMDGLIGTAEKQYNVQGNSVYNLIPYYEVSSDVGFDSEENGSYRTVGGNVARVNTNIDDLGDGAFTIETWIKYNGGDGLSHAPLGKKNYYDHGFYVEYAQDLSSICFMSDVDKYTWSTCSTTGLIHPGEWQHFVFAMDTNTASIYIDGDLAGQSPVTFNINNDFVHEDFYLFCYKADCGNVGPFSIDEVRVSNIARNSSEIYNYYHNTQEPYYEISTAKQNNYDFNNGNLLTEYSLGEVQVNLDTGVIINQLTGDEKDTDYEYAANTTKHILSAPKTKTISDTVDSKEQDLYYDELPLGQVNKVNLTKEDYLEDDVEINRTFNNYGLVSTEISPENATTTLDYDTYNIYPETKTNSLNQVTTYDYNLLNGQPEVITEPNGKITQNTYDAFGRLIKVEISNPASPLTLITKQEIVYNDTSLPRYIETKNYFTSTNFTLSREYLDGLDRTIQKKAQLAGVNQYSTIDTSYDSQGRIARQSLPAITSSLSYSSPDLSNPAKTYVYDSLNRVLTEATPVGTTSYEYNGFTTTITDANGHQKDLTKDAYGNLIEVTEYETTNSYTTSYEYTLTNKLKKITDSQGNIRNFEYDELDNLLWQDMVHKPAVTNPKKINYTYDKNGNVLTETSFKGDNISYTYDQLNRPLKEKLASTTKITYNYDQNGDTGYLTSAYYPGNSSKIYDYDILGRSTTVTTKIDNQNFTMHYDYNLNGDTTSIIYPNSWEVDYTFNNIGQIDSVALDQGSGAETLVNNIEYNQLGQMIHLERANGVITDYTYDPQQAFRLTNLTTTHNTSTLQDISYTYDNVGNITQLVDSSATDLAKTVWYDYDDLNRLASSTINYLYHPENNYSRTYEYDSIGNMTLNSELGTLNYTKDNPHQLSSYSTKTFTYDNAGNLINNTNTNFNWDWRNRLNSSNNSGSEQDTYYTYDHNNQRLMKKTEEWVWVPADPEPDPFESFLSESSGSLSMLKSEDLVTLDGGIPLPGEDGTWKLEIVDKEKYVDNYWQQDKSGDDKSHIYLNTIKIATVNENEDPYYLLGDHLGSSSILTNSTGTISEMTDYEDYGKITYESTLESRDNSYKFTGKEVDSQTDLQYFGARYLENEVGRFTAIDPLLVKLHNSQEVSRITEKDLRILLADPQKLNSYSYAYNNPIIMNDPTGEGPVIVLIVVGVVELVFSTWDALDASNALFGENVSTGDKVESGGYLVAGLALPGGGYGHVDEGVSALKAVDKTVSKSINNAVNKIGNTISDHLTKTDYAGFIRDLSKAPVWSHNLGRNFDHYDEVMSAYKGLQNNVSKLTRYLDNYNLEKKTVDTINKAIDTAKSHINRIDNILRSH